MNPDEVLKLMKDRRSIRMYTDDPVSDDDIQTILEAARWCQSASNKQPWRFIIVKNTEIIKKISKLAIYGSFIKKAPVAIAIVARKSENPKWYIQDTAMVTHQMCLMIWALGLGTCWIGSLDREKAGQILNLKSDEFLTTFIPVGYPKRIPNPTPRKKLDEIVSYLD